MKDDWSCGYACAVANMYRAHDEPVSAREALESAGLTSVKALRECGVDEYDIEALKPLIRDIQRRKRVGKLQGALPQKGNA